MKAQSAVLDGLFFMMVCGAAATLLFYTSGLYGASTSRQIATVYNYEYAGTALVSLHYARDKDGKWFWIEMKNKLSKANPSDQIESYLKGEANPVWGKIKESSPSRKTVLYFVGESSFYCYGEPVKCKGDLSDANYQNVTVFASSVNLIDNLEKKWEVVLQLYY